MEKSYIQENDTIQNLKLPHVLVLRHYKIQITKNPDCQNILYYYLQHIHTYTFIQQNLKTNTMNHIFYGYNIYTNITPTILKLLQWTNLHPSLQNSMKYNQ